MKIRRFAVPPQAFVVFVTCTLGAMAVGVTVASWIVAAVIAFVRHDGLATLLEFPREYIFFATIAPWFDDTDKSIWNYASSVLLLVCSLSLAVYGLRLGRFIVVKKFGWMTDEEVEAMAKRDPGW